MSEELKPCPFCFGKPERADEAIGREYVYCENSNCIDQDGTVYEDDWNNAHCWKQIDAQASTIRQQAETIKKLREALAHYHYRNHIPAPESCAGCGIIEMYLGATEPKETEGK